MFWRTGIYTKEERKNKPEGVWKPIAFSVLEELNQNYTEQDELFLTEVYGSLATQANVFKITRKNRFQDILPKLTAELAARFVGTTISIHDIGSSNAITSLEWYEDLIRANVPVTMHATDYYATLDIVKLLGGKWSVVYDADGRAVQFLRPPFVLSAISPEAKRYPLNRYLANVGKQKIIPLANAAHAANTGVTTIELFHPLCLAKAKADKNFTVGRHDLFQPFPRSHHVIRGMNILNRCYFSDEQLVKAIRNCAQALPVGGLLITGRSVDEEDGRLTATVFLRGKNRFEPLWDWKEGSELKPLILPLEL